MIFLGCLHQSLIIQWRMVIIWMGNEFDPGMLHTANEIVCILLPACILVATAVNAHNAIINLIVQHLIRYIQGAVLQHIYFTAK